DRSLLARVRLRGPRGPRASCRLGPPGCPARYRRRRRPPGEGHGPHRPLSAVPPRRRGLRAPQLPATSARPPRHPKDYHPRAHAWRPDPPGVGGNRPHEFAAQGATTKHEVAGVIAGRFPELAPHRPKFRKPWMSEDERQAIFDAAAFALIPLKNYSTTRVTAAPPAGPERSVPRTI